MYWKINGGFYILLLMKIAQGMEMLTILEKMTGNGEADTRCARQARNHLAVKMDAANTCTGLDWDWGSAPSYETGSTYFEKKKVVENYQPPIVLGGARRLPIFFRVGASINMHIEFTSDNFTWGSIKLLDTLDESYDVYSGDTETIMISIEMIPSSDYVALKTWYYGWVNHVFIYPYPFIAGSMHKITFKAQADVMQVLFNDVQVTQYGHHVPPEDARILQFSDVGMLLHKIDFVGI